jgi:thiamine kinase-like enzyme
MPSFDWLSEHFLRDYSSEKPVDWALLDDDEAWHQPLVREHVPGQLREVATAMHAQRERLYTIAEALPRVFCHLDFWPKNLFLRADGRVVLIDWGLSGDGCVGEDIGNLVPDTVFDHFLPAAVLPELEDAVLHGYLSGLAEGGWRGDADIVRLGMWASAVKYDWLTPHLLLSAGAEKQMAYGGQAEVDAAHRFSERGAALLFTCRRALDALELADRLGIAT